MVGVGQWEGANSGPLSQVGQNQGPWFGVGEREGVNHWSLVRFSMGGRQQWASKQIQPKSRTMV